MKRILFFLIMLISIINGLAVSFTIEDITYNILSMSTMTCEISNVFVFDNREIDVPEYIEYNGRSFSVTGVAAYAFMGSRVSSVTLPKSVTDIGFCGFDGCTMQKLTVKGEKVHIDECSFRNCSFLKNINGSNAFYNIPRESFKGCSSLGEILLGEYVSFIGDSAFQGCGSLTSISIPSSVTYMGNYIFVNCQNLKQIKFEDGETEINLGLFNIGINIEELYIGRNLSDLQSWQRFINSKDLKNLTIGNNVTKIGGGAFEGCSSLSTITFGSSVANIGGNIFEQCYGIKEINIAASIPPIFENNPHIADEVYLNSVLNVPIGCKDKYLNAEYWRNFWEIRESEELGITDCGYDTDVEITILNNTIRIYSCFARTLYVYDISGKYIDSWIIKPYTYTIKILPKGMYVFNGKTFKI